MAINGLEKITDKIRAEAQAEASRILADAEAEAKRIRDTYAKRADEIRAALSAESERECTELITRAKNGASVSRKNAVLRMRGELVDQAFDAALASLRSLTVEKYTELLSGLLCAAFLEQVAAEETSRTLYGEEDAMAPEAYEILLSKQDREKCGEALLTSARTRLVGRVEKKKLDLLTLSDECAEIDGGLILRCGDVASNCSFALLFADLRRELEGEVSHALFDPKERK